MPLPHFLVLLANAGGVFVSTLAFPPSYTDCKIQWFKSDISLPYLRTWYQPSSQINLFFFVKPDFFFFFKGEVGESNSFQQVPNTSAKSPQICSRGLLYSELHKEHQCTGTNQSPQACFAIFYSSTPNALCRQILVLTKASVSANSVFAKHAGFITRRASGKGYHQICQLCVNTGRLQKRLLLHYLAQAGSPSKNDREDWSPL